MIYIEFSIFTENIGYRYTGRTTDASQKTNGMCIFFIIFTHKFNLMRTNIELDDVLVKQAIKLSKLKTKREVVQEALKSYIASMKKRELLNLKGRVSWEGNLKEMRSL